MKHEKPTYEELEQQLSALQERLDLEFRRSKAFEKSAHERAELYHNLLERSPQLILEVDMNGHITYANPAAVKQFGYSLDLLGSHVLDFMPDEDHQAELETLRRGFADGDNIIVTRVKASDGSVRYVLNNSVPLYRKGEMQGLTVFGVDITDVVRAEEALRESEARYRTLTEAAEDFIYLIDKNLKVKYVNSAGARQFGKRPQDLVDRDVAVLFPETGQRQAQNLGRVLEKGETLYFENPVNFPGGVMWLSARLVPVRDSSGEITGVLGISRDITENKKAEQEKEELQRQLMHSQKMEAIGTLAGGMAHDFNNALAVILGTAEVGLRKTKPDDPNYSKFEKIVKASERARHLTLKLLTFARKEKLEVTAVDISELVKDIMEMLHRSVSKRIRIHTDFMDDDCPVSVDVNQMHQGLLNILINGCEAMPQGGELRIRTRRTGAGDLPGSLPGGDYAVVEIMDTGHGIPDESLHRIFEPFFTTKEKGTGLGLSITLGIVRNHGGDVLIDSGPDGTHFSVYLPITHAEEALLTPVDDSALKDIKGHGRTILIIDDEEDFTELTCEILQKLGFHPLAASNGNDALKTFENSNGEIDVILLDLIMPDLDGAELYAQLKQLDPNAKIILCSGGMPGTGAEELEENGVNIYLQKPFTIVDLCEKIDELIGTGMKSDK